MTYSDYINHLPVYSKLKLCFLFRIHLINDLQKVNVLKGHKKLDTCYDFQIDFNQPNGELNLLLYTIDVHDMQVCSLNHLALF